MKIKNVGIVRRIDNLGRIVLPIEMRKELNIEIKDPVEISLEGSNIILRKYENRCIFCGTLRPQNVFQGKKICSECLEELSKGNEEKQNGILR